MKHHTDKEINEILDRLEQERKADRKYQLEQMRRITEERKLITCLIDLLEMSDSIFNYLRIVKK